MMKPKGIGKAATPLEQYGFRMGQQTELAIDTHWYEYPSDDPNILEVWTYTDQISYRPGDTVRFHSYCSGSSYCLKVERDGPQLEPAHSASDLPGTMPSTPDNAYEIGAGWPVSHEWTIPDDQRSGPYVITSTTASSDGMVREHHHLIIIGPAAKQRDSAKKKPYLMIFATSTWLAYTEWGGANHYQGIAGKDRNEYSPRISPQRPWARGFVRLPEGAPHAFHEGKIPPHWAPQIPFFNWAMGSGYSKWYVGGSYAEYDRLLVQWAEREGYSFDYISQHQLQFQPELLNDYNCVVIAGHDEYWSWEMRDAIDEFVDGGGNVARFAGNYFWQIRLEDDGQTQVAYKHMAHENDPVRDDPDKKHQLTTIWEDRVLNRPGALTMGLNGSRGLYARMGAMTPRHSGGFTVYRPAHWVFAGTDLYYGDVFGSEAGIFGFEVDGLEYTFRRGLPYPTGEDGAPVADISILAMAPAVLREENHGNALGRVWWADDDASIVAQGVYGEVTPETLEKVQYGSGMVVEYRRGKGSVVNTGSCAWVQGLKKRDFFTEQVTRNILNRLGAGEDHTDSEN